MIFKFIEDYGLTLFPRFLFFVILGLDIIAFIITSYILYKLNKI